MRLPDNLKTKTENKKHPSADMEMNLSLFGGFKLLVSKNARHLEIKGDDNQSCIQINILNEGLEISCESSSLKLSATDSVKIAAKNIELDASEKLTIHSGGNLVTQVEKDALLEVGGHNKTIAEEQSLVSRLGDFRIKANDDVKVDGERVKLNCEDYGRRK